MRQPLWRWNCPPVRTPLLPSCKWLREAAAEKGEAIVTSAEVLQELLHAYLPVNRLQISRARCALAGPRDGPGDSTPSRLPPRPPDLEGQAGHPSEVPGVPGSQGDRPWPGPWRCSRQRKGWWSRDDGTRGSGLPGPEDSWRWKELESNDGPLQEWLPYYGVAGLRERSTRLGTRASMGSGWLRPCVLHFPLDRHGRRRWDWPDPDAHAGCTSGPGP
jgi:hypothetical protein